MGTRYHTPHLAARAALLVVLSCVAPTLAGCKMQANADSSGNFKPGGEAKKPKPDAVPDCYKGTGSGPGGFGGWRRFAADEAPTPAGDALDSLLRHDRTVGYDGGGEGPGWTIRCQY